MATIVAVTPGIAAAGEARLHASPVESGTAAPADASPDADDEASGEELAPASTAAPAETSPDAGDQASEEEVAPASTAAPADASPNPGSTAAPTDAAGIITPASQPPRVDGTYIGGTVAAGLGLLRVNDFPTPDPLLGGTASVRVGQVLYPWLTLGLEVVGSMAHRFAEPRQRLLQGAVVIDFGFLPVPRIPLSLHVGFGAGGGAVRQADRVARAGFGGAVFTGAVRYEVFPLAARKRPTRGGGFAVGPELGWLGFTPAAKGRPMSNTIYLGLFIGYYFGS